MCMAKEWQLSTNYDRVEVKNNEERQRYEVELDGQVAMIVYKRKGNSIIFVHTEVPSALEGHGIANTLAHVALEDARAQKLNVIPLCPFVAAYIRRHQDYLPLLTEREKQRVLGSH